uniref:MBD domain-containing protein n=1 Tax=Strigamia maritima TaxID=126957 RepID=T1IL32_STRMM
CDRKQVEPDATATQDAKDRFDRNKTKSRAIILQCLVPRLQPAAMKFPTTKQVWDHLKALFEPSSLAREAALLETFYLIRRKDNKEVDSFIARVEKAADDLAGAADDLKPADRNKAYLLINRIGKEYEHQVQAIYQWQTADFTFEKVSKALLAEANCRRLAAESDKAMESKVKRAPVPGKSGWIREQVQRQSGATAGQWDVYFYPPGQQVKLRSRPEVRSYCENELNEPYVAADYDWKPSQKPVDTVVQEPSTEQAVVEPQAVQRVVAACIALIEVSVSGPRAVHTECGCILSQLPCDVPQRSTLRYKLDFSALCGFSSAQDKPLESKISK